MPVLETLKLIELKKKGLSDKEIETEVLVNNYLQKNRLSTVKRMFVEFKRRLNYMDSNFIELITELPFDSKKHLLFANIMETYPMMLEFMIETVLPKLQLLDFSLHDSDFFKFLYIKEEKATKTLTDNTRKKLKQVTFKILEQAGLIDNGKNKKIMKPILNYGIIRYYANNTEILKGLLMSDKEIITNIR